MDIRVQWKQYDKNGILIPELTFEHRANTLVIAFFKILMCKLGTTTVGTENFTDTGNTSRTYTGYSYETSFEVIAGTGDANYGIVVGTGTNAVAIDDYALQTKIAHGGSTDQLVYSVTTVDNAVVQLSDQVYILISRTFTNNSGGDITVNEVGLYGKVISWYACFDRTLSTNIIYDSNSATCSYKIGSSL